VKDPAHEVSAAPQPTRISGRKNEKEAVGKRENEMVEMFEGRTMVYIARGRQAKTAKKALFLNRTSHSSNRDAKRDWDEATPGTVGGEAGANRRLLPAPR
jgi:hypothetical protein